MKISPLGEIFHWAKSVRAKSGKLLEGPLPPLVADQLFFRVLYLGHLLCPNYAQNPLKRLHSFTQLYTLTPLNMRFHAIRRFITNALLYQLSYPGVSPSSKGMKLVLRFAAHPRCPHKTVKIV